MLYSQTAQLRLFVQRQLRHSDARITLGIYGHVIGDDQRDAVQHRSTRLEAISQIPQEDDSTSELNHPEEILWVVFPANDHTTKVMKPSEQALDLPTSPVAAQHATILRGFRTTCAVVRSNQLHAEALTNLPVQRVAVVSAVADQPFGSFGKEASLEGGFDELCFMR